MRMSLEVSFANDGLEWLTRYFALVLLDSAPEPSRVLR